jgi:hypothetical protein
MSDQTEPLGYSPYELGVAMNADEIFAISDPSAQQSEWLRAAVLLNREILKRPILAEFAPLYWYNARLLLQELHAHPIDGLPEAAMETECIIDELRERF